MLYQGLTLLRQTGHQQLTGSGQAASGGTLPAARADSAADKGIVRE